MYEEGDEVNKSIIVNGVDYGGLLPVLKMNSVTHRVLCITRASCLLYFSFAAYRTE